MTSRPHRLVPNNCRWEPAKRSSDGYPIRDWEPPSFSCPALPSAQRDRPHHGTGTGEPLGALKVEEAVRQFWSPFGEGHGGVLAGRSASGMERTNAAGSSQ